MAPGSTKSRRSARKFALREDDAAAQYEVSRRKETRTTASGRKKTVVIEESLRNDPAPPPKRKKQKTSSAPAVDENPGQPDENIDLPDITVVTGHHRPHKVRLQSMLRIGRPETIHPDPKGLHSTVCAAGAPFA